LLLKALLLFAADLVVLQVVDLQGVCCNMLPLSLLRSDLIVATGIIAVYC
jgi:hypothetical protein